MSVGGTSHERQGLDDSDLPCRRLLGCDRTVLVVGTMSATHTGSAAHRGEAVAAGPALTITVHGTPAPQGSKRGFVNKGGGVSMVESSKKVAPWREAVKWAALEGPRNPRGPASNVCLHGLHEQCDGDFDTLSHTVCCCPCHPFTGPVDVAVTFYLPRPKGHYRTGRNAHLLRDAAPRFPAGKPDLDKLVRSTLDALGEAAVFRDDAQVVAIGAGKVYADQHPVGADITVWAI